MPAVTLQNSTTHSSQNCGVRIALAAETLAVVTIDFGLDARRVEPAGRQPSAGTRTFTAPNIMTRSRPRPRVTNNNTRACRRRPRPRRTGRSRRRRTRAAAATAGGDQRPAAEAHDRHAGGQARPVREPLDQRGDRGDVADAEPDAADDAVAEVDQPQLARWRCRARRPGSRRPEAGRDEHRLTRAVAVHPGAEHGGGEPEHHDRDGEDHPDRGQAGVEVGDQRVLVDAGRVDLADAEVDGRGRRAE